jgi:hypothetical protein
MSGNLSNPTVVIEGRAPLPNQLVTRQTYLPMELAKLGIQTLFVEAGASGTYDQEGHVQDYTVYDSEEGGNEALTPGSYAWRLRDPVWEDGDPAAYPDGQGYNSQRARAELSTRRNFAHILAEMGLGNFGIPIIPTDAARQLPPGEIVFIKPNHISDISNEPSARAQLTNIEELDDVSPEFSTHNAIQRLESTISAQELAGHLGLRVDELDADVNYLHAVRVFSPLWLPSEDTPAIEIRLTDPRQDVGRFFATRQYLLEPEHVQNRLPRLAQLHRYVHAAFAERYGPHNYLTFDYLALDDGSIKILNGLVRGLTPNLEHQRPEVQHLANATADVEVVQLARLALERFNA